MTLTAEPEPADRPTAPDMNVDISMHDDRWREIVLFEACEVPLVQYRLGQPLGFLGRLKLGCCYLVWLLMPA